MATKQGLHMARPRILIWRQEVNDINATIELCKSYRKPRRNDLRQKNNKFINLQSEEEKTLLFDPEKIEQLSAEYRGRKTQRIQYTVTERNSVGNNKKYFTVVNEHQKTSIHTLAKDIHQSKFQGLA